MRGGETLFWQVAGRRIAGTCHSCSRLLQLARASDLTVPYMSKALSADMFFSSTLENDRETSAAAHTTVIYNSLPCMAQGGTFCGAVDPG